MKRKRKILHVAWLKASYGGAHKYLDRLVQRLHSEGWNVALAVNRQPLERPFLNELAELGVEVFYLPMEEDAPASAQQLDDVIRHWQPNVVHFNSGARQPRRIAEQMECWNRREYKSIFTMHLPLINRKPNLGQRIAAAVPLTYTHDRIGDRTKFARRFDRIISVSEKLAHLNVEALQLDQTQVVSIPNGVDVTRFTPHWIEELETEELETDSKATIRIGACGGLVQQKRFDLLVAAVAKLKEYPVEVFIAGEGEQRPQLEKQIDELGLRGRVHLVGHQSDIPSFLRGLNLFAMPSDYEAFPYSQLEAMASGLASVVTDVGDLPLMVRDQVDGFVVATDNVDSLSNALEKLIVNNTLRKQMGRSARNRVVNSFEQTFCESKTVSLIESLVS